MESKIDLFKQLGRIDDFEPFISFGNGLWCVLWIKYEEDGYQFGRKFYDKELGNAIEKAYNWYITK